MHSITFLAVFYHNAKNNFIYHVREVFEKKFGVPTLAISHFDKCDVLITHNKDGHGTIISSQNSLIIGEMVPIGDFIPICSDYVDKHPITTDMAYAEFWGNYLHLHTNSQNMSIFRSINCDLPIFYTKVNDNYTLISSDISLMYSILGKIPAFNIKYIATFLQRSNFVSENTPFQDVFELPRGFSINFHLNTVQAKLSWKLTKPHTIIEKNKILQDDAMNTLIQITKVYTAKYDNILLDFSGGLDSTALLYILHHIHASSNKSIIPINHFCPKIKASDERHIAQEICRQLNIPLVEHNTINSLPFSPIQDSNFRPNYLSAFLMYLKDELQLSKLVSQYKNRIYINGHAGDHIFAASPPIKNSVCDAFISNGCKNLYSLLKETAYYDRSTLMQLCKILIKNVTRYLMGKYTYDNTEQILSQNRPDMLNYEYFSEIYKENLYAPNAIWGEDKILPGKFTHINSLNHCIATLNTELRYYFGTEAKSPLLCGPFIDLIFYISTYDLYKNGYDRFIWREMISKKFKTNAVWRKDKGETTGVVQLGIAENLAYIKNLCMEGFLVKNGIVNKNKLEKSIIENARGYNNTLPVLINIICTEIFISTWT